MKLRMTKNSPFAMLLRSPWWIRAALALLMGLVAMALLPAQYRVVGALSGLPFVVIAVIAGRRQWHLPSAARVAQTQQTLARMAWPAFAALLEQAFRRDGCAVQAGKSSGVDFELERQGRRMLVSARRWKAAHTGLEVLRTLQAAREAAEAADALYIGLGPLSDNARPYAAQHRLALWRAEDRAHALRGLQLT